MLSIVNPCYLDEYARIRWDREPPDVEYIVASDTMPIYFDTFVLDILNGKHTLCGALFYDAYYGDSPIPINSSSSPLRKTTQYSTTLLLQSNDPTLIGTSVIYRLEAKLENYPDRTIAKAATITYLDPCLAPFEITASVSFKNIGSYKYTGAPFTYQVPEIIPTPWFCEVSYECTPTLGNLGCDEVGFSVFDQDTRTYSLTLTTDQYSLHPPGDYAFIITGSTGGNVPIATESQFIFSLINLCPEDVVMTPVAINIEKMVYELESPESGRTFYKPGLLTLTPDIDCGRIYINFYNNLVDKSLYSVAFY